MSVLFKLKEKRLGLNKGIHTLIIAVASCNNIISIFLFGVTIGIAFSTGTVQNSKIAKLDMFNKLYRLHTLTRVYDSNIMMLTSIKPI